MIRSSKQSGSGNGSSGSSKSAVDQFKSVITDLDGLVGGVQGVASFVLSPNIGYNNIFYAFYLLGGFYSFIVALVRLLTQKNDAYSATYHFAGLAGAGFTFVYWASYLSPLATVIAVVAVFSTGMVAGKVTYKGGKVTKKGIRDYYPTPDLWKIFYAGLIVSLLFPLAIYLHPASPPGPAVKLSPSQPDVTLDRGQNKTQIANVIAFQATSNLFITAQTPGANNSLIVSLNGTIGGPYVLGTPELNHQYPIKVEIYAPLSMKMNGTYAAVLNFTYEDQFFHHYYGSSTITVYLGAQPVKSFAFPLFYFLIGIGVVTLISLTLWATLRRKDQIG